MTAPRSTSTISPEGIAATIPPRQREALAELAAGRQPGVAAAGLELRGLVVHDAAAGRLVLTATGRLVAEALGAAS